MTGISLASHLMSFQVAMVKRIKRASRAICIHPINQMVAIISLMKTATKNQVNLEDIFKIS